MIGSGNKVTTIGFKLIPEEDGGGCAEIQKHKREEAEGRNMLELNHRRDLKIKPNFTFEYSYPAVIFDKVCFTVDRSQQQANFLNECICRLKGCLSLVSGQSAIGDNLQVKQSQKVEILKSINLNVPYGSIFGLLGPSSCGKTTLLRCLVGLLKPNSGDIRLFCHSSDSVEDDEGDNQGCCPTGSKQRSRAAKRANRCKVPGINVGYMPQDLGLYEDFTIRQLLTMFGRYMKMGSKLIASRIDFMASFLDLPHVDREIRSLSGGQKRRVSFAIACLHMPPLIILDEPTVGVDPLLRQSIWKYLRRLADHENKTIIITTHYIEEAAQADQVALMRAGEILVQDTPSRIMEVNQCTTLEEAFLKICNNVQQNGDPLPNSNGSNNNKRYKLYPQPRFNWHDKLGDRNVNDDYKSEKDSVVREMKLRNMMAMADAAGGEMPVDKIVGSNCNLGHNVRLDDKINQLSMEPNIIFKQPITVLSPSQPPAPNEPSAKLASISATANRLAQTVTNGSPTDNNNINWLKNNQKSRKLVDKDLMIGSSRSELVTSGSEVDKEDRKRSKRFRIRLEKSFTLMWALLYKNYRRNVNSLPLLAFQFMLPVIQMISFSLCVGGRPSDVGLGLVNRDQPAPAHLLVGNSTTNGDLNDTFTDYEDNIYIPLTEEELLSKKYLNFIDKSMLSVKRYDNLDAALEDVGRAKLWAAMEISENFTISIQRRFNLENFYQLDSATIQSSVIKLYPDRSNKVLDMICQRSLINSYRQFLLDHFDHFKKLPIEIKEPIFSIKPNLISNSIDGYTESIAAGLLASLTYIMAAGLTTFIMVVERSEGILERTFTSGINPVAYLIAHALFRSFVMMLQIAVVMFLTFYLLQQPMVGSIALAYLMLMTLNLTGIAYGLLISSIVTDQNGAALTIVSSLVVKITMSGILWPFEAIPHWLRSICYIQPLTMPVQALKTITLKGSNLADTTVQLGFLVSITWLALFLTIAASRFKFYQH